jgi:hypothetical protein
MQPKYFQYISKNKIDMLYDQLGSQIGLLEFTSKFGVQGAGVELGIKNDPTVNSSLIHRTRKVMIGLEKNKMLKPLIKYRRKINTKGYYSDTSLWHIGLYAYMSDTSGLITSNTAKMVYFAFKKRGNSLILLAGSPNNLLGIKSVDKQFEPSESTDLFLYRKHVFQHVLSYISAEEKSGITPPIFELLQNEELPYPLYLCNFCLLDLKELQETTIEISFKIYFQYNIGKLLKNLVVEKFLLNFLGQELDLDRSWLYVGSPLYTALP